MNRTFPRTRRGVTAVEFAMVAPMFFMAMFAGIEFVRANIIRNSAENAAYIASRMVIVPGATKAEAIAKAEAMMNLAGARNIEVTFIPDIINEDTPFVSTEIRIPMNENSWGGAMFFRDSSIRATSRLRTERTPLVQARSLPSILNPPPPPPPEEPLPEDPPPENPPPEDPPPEDPPPEDPPTDPGDDEPVTPPPPPPVLLEFAIFQNHVLVKERGFFIAGSRGGSTRWIQSRVVSFVR